MNYNIISDDFIRKNNTRILSGYEIKPRYVPESKTQKGTQQNTQREPINNENNNVHDNHRRFLMALYNCQYSKTLTEVSNQAGFTAGSGSRIANECVKKNLIKIIQVPFGKGRPKYPVLTPEGYKILGIQKMESLGRGAGYEHTLYQHLIAEHFSDFNLKIELNRNDKFIDVSIETNEILICIEVAMTSVNEKINIEKDFSLAKANSVIAACINEKVKKEVENIVTEMSEHIRNNTKIILISELLKTDPDELIHNHQLQMNL